jgi:hypothetical protein
MSKYAVEIDLTTIDGNAFAIMGAVQRKLKQAGASKEELDQYLTESMSGDYDHLIRTAMNWVIVV